MAIRYSGGKAVSRGSSSKSSKSSYKMVRGVPTKVSKPSGGGSSGSSTPSTPTKSDPKVKAGYYSAGKYHYYIGKDLYSMPTSQKSSMDRAGQSVKSDTGTFVKTIGVPKTINAGVITKQTPIGTKLDSQTKVGSNILQNIAII